MTPHPLRLPQLPQPSHWFPHLALGRFTMVMEKQRKTNTTGRDGFKGGMEVVKSYLWDKAL